MESDTQMGIISYMSKVYNKEYKPYNFTVAYNNLKDK